MDGLRTAVDSASALGVAKNSDLLHRAAVCVDFELEVYL